MPKTTAKPTNAKPTHQRRVSIGYVPLTDCSPLIVAVELGMFARRGFDVRLSREAGWATVREKMLHGELDAAHAPASMVFEMSHGLDVSPVPSLTGLVLAHNGNAITLSHELRELGVTDAFSLHEVIRARPERRFTFAGVLKYSSQHYLMRRWLQSGGIDPDRDVDIAIVPPPLVAECMERGHLDGYCVAEPWSSVGLMKGAGWCVTLTAELDPMHPEKVFMVRSDFEHERHDDHVQLVAALIEAARWCDDQANRRKLAALLSLPRYLDVPESTLRNALIGPYRMGDGRACDASDAIVFNRDDASRPSPEKARWVVEQLRRNHLEANLPSLSTTDIRNLYREDIYEEALALVPAA